MKKMVLLLLASLAFSTPLFAGPAGVVTNVKGEAVILRGGKTLPASVGMEIRQDDRFKTGAASRLDFAVNKTAGVRMLGPTELDLKETAKENMQVDLKLGNVIVNMKKRLRGAKFQVGTPAAVLAVRGTQFWGREEKKTDSSVTTFAVRRGKVEVTDKTSGQSFKLNKGQALDLSVEAGTAPSVRKALPAEMGAMEQATDIRTSLGS